MTYEIFRYIFIGGAILCGIMLIISVLIFILFNIPKVISDLSGATARKAIKNIRENNEKTGDKTHRVSAFNQERGKLTDKISASGNLQQSQPNVNFGINTTKIQTQQLQPEDFSNQTTVLGADNETTVLGESNETTVLNAGNETTVLNTENETTVLEPVPMVGETAVLSATVELDETSVLSDTSFIIEYDITFIHTNEVIGAEAFV